jgi:hypothetical protein
MEPGKNNLIPIMFTKTDKHLKPILIFQSKASKVYLQFCMVTAPLRQVQAENVSDKHSSLIHMVVKYSKKVFFPLFLDFRNFSSSEAAFKKILTIICRSFLA